VASRASSDVVVRFVGDTGDLTKGLDGLKGRFTGVATSMQGIAQAGAVVGAISFFGNAIQEAREAERVGRKTEAVIKSTGGVAKVTAGHVSELSGQMSELAGVDDEVIQQGNNVLLTFKGIRNEVGQGNDIFDQAAKASLDMSASLDKTGDSGADMQASVIRVGKALNDPIKGMTALAKVGVTFTEQQKAQVTALVESGDVMGAQKIILRELQSEFGGMAEASADATGKAAVSWGNFAETVGQRVMPAVNAVSNWALGTGLPALGDVAETVGDVVTPAFRTLVSAGAGVVDMWQDLSGPVQSSIIALAAWQLVGDRVTGVFGRMGGATRGFGDDVRVAMGAFDVNRVTGAFMAMEERIPVVGRMGAAFRDTAGTTMALGQAMGGMTGHMASFGAAAKGVGSAGMVGLRAAGGSLVSFLGGPWGLAFAGATLLIGLFANKSNQAAKIQEDLAAAGKTVAKALAEQNGVINKGVRESAAKVLSDKEMLKTAREMGIPLSYVTEALLGNETAMRKVNGAAEEWAVAQAKSGENSGVTAGKYALMTTGLVALRDSQQGSTEALLLEAEAARKSSDAYGAHTTATQESRTSSEQMASILDGLGIQVDEDTASFSQLRQAIEGLTNAQTNAIDSEESFHAALDGVTASVQANGTTLDINTAAGRANRDAVEEAATASRNYMLTQIESGVPMAVALEAHRQRIIALQEETTKVFGANSGANTLIDTYARVPDEVITAISTKGYEETAAKLANLHGGQRLLAEGLADTPANRKALQIYQYATGGEVRGPGGPTQDRIPAMLSNGEFVQRADATAYYGPGFMHALNAKRIPREALPGYAGGGLVAPFPVDVSKTKIPDPGAFRPVPGGASITQLQQFALAQRGKLYQWGATGPNTWDCSGLVGALWALVHGKNPYQRHMTTAGMGAGRYGMKPGPGKVTVYLGPGHTAANVAGLHAEAYGGNGVPLAIGRVGTSLGFYNQILHMARGGLVRLKNDPEARQQSFLERGWPEPAARVGMFKDGGWLMPGQLAYNETRKPEAVLNQDQLKALSKPSVHKTMNVNLHVANRPVDVMAQLRRAEMMAGF
jgi:cell wall-associated NlpC family hydrolase